MSSLLKDFLANQKKNVKRIVLDINEKKREYFFYI